MAIIDELAKAQTAQNLRKMIESAEANLSDEVLASNFVSSDSLKRVEIHVCKGYIRVDMGKVNNLNIADLNEEEQRFGLKNGSNLVFTAFKEQLKKLISIETSIRNLRAMCAVGDSAYMHLDTFQNEFFPKFEKKKEEFEEVVEEIRTIFDEEMDNFSLNVTKMAKKICPDKLEEVKRQVDRQTKATADSFCRKFSMMLSTDFSISQLSDADLIEVVKESNKAFVRKRFAEFQNGMMQELADAVAVYYRGVSNSVTENLDGIAKTKCKLRKAAQKVKRDNVGDLPLLVGAVEQAQRITGYNDKTLALEECFMLLALLYGKANDLGYNLDTKQLPENGTYRVSVNDLLAEYESWSED